MSKPILKYVGNGSLIEIPARDLTEDDLKNIAWTGWDADKLVESGLYEPVINLNITFEHDSVATAETRPWTKEDSEKYREAFEKEEKRQTKKRGK